MRFASQSRTGVVRKKGPAGGPAVNVETRGLTQLNGNNGEREAHSAPRRGSSLRTPWWRPWQRLRGSMVGALRTAGCVTDMLKG